LGRVDGGCLGRRLRIMKEFEWDLEKRCVAGGYVPIYEVRQAVVCLSYGQEVKAGTSGEQAVSVSKRGYRTPTIAYLFYSMHSE
jgi:hypothetical protein